MKMNKLLKSMAAIALAVAMAATAAPVVPTEAATYTAQPAAKVKTITKTGKHVVVAPANAKENFVQFKASKAGTYVFSFDGILYDGENDDINNKPEKYYAKMNKNYVGQVNVVPIVNGKLGEEFSLVNQHAMFGTVAAMYEMDIADFIEAAEADGMSFEDICAIGAQAGIELTHTYSVKLKKGQIIQFDMINTAVLQKMNKKKQNVVITIQKK